jgi:hypothetical protein
MFRKIKEEAALPSSPPEVETYEDVLELTKDGTQVKLLLESLLGIRALTEVSELLILIEKKELNTQQARDLLAPCRAKLKAEQGLLEAIYAILPQWHLGEGPSPKLSLHTKRKKISNQET